MNKRHFTGLVALGAAASLALAGCASGNQAEGGSNEGGDGDLGTITLGFLPSWTDGLSTAYLLEDQLEKIGYTVEMQELTEAGPLYAGLAQGDVDIYPSAWPELTHKSYMEKYGDQIEDLGAYYGNAKLTIAVPEYVDIDSIEDLADNADRFDGTVFGIEPGAGLTAQTQDSMIPEYGLDGTYELKTSSTAAMLTELDSAIAAERDIVVTSWRPFWANEAYGLKDLEDPRGAMGEAEALHFLGTAGFAEEFPEAAEYIAGISLDDEQYASLEDTVVNEFGEGKEADAIDEWIAAHTDAYDTLIAD
ncbi:glycine betaine ABC transporter substrate-binding protein [Microbacterium sp. EYE_5]|uniref:glycine betaine ABC transporter substrate-binding protein n=1 Tax=unclassified Microbacterium TaxID=2609290 RepID=UPI0020068038|nr:MULTISPECIES: glycine betaine ABC transporter substrate-binding protein [unclassified Microbacterium]MCK6079649.1 glycine betaine ABC transporter substrate-binding protein [Microbacterium sp. EYE_382]MCK6084920.1 glycine betaine ABC transporter substrate-binding protein [Microbacterium sp. EYE_384]MCK6122854.1 glycine betaine ABC transporter substrate-binding protein [Microbacterium sp. EYE_80]MCK6125683.1 glycine betaine ABC transporter substrate-binding protein [Microbacterium sp. EYE_79]